jgi:hypothetical protein
MMKDIRLLGGALPQTVDVGIFLPGKEVQTQRITRQY